MELHIICSERVLKFLKKINNKIDNSKIHLSISMKKYSQYWCQSYIYK